MRHLLGVSHLFLDKHSNIADSSQEHMIKSYYDQTFENIDYLLVGFSTGEFESCTFKNCNFSEVNLSHGVFMECEFVDCDFTGVKLGNTAFKDVKFVGQTLGRRFLLLQSISIGNDF